MPPNTDCRYQRPVGGVGEWPVGSHLGTSQETYTKTSCTFSERRASTLWGIRSFVCAGGHPSHQREELLGKLIKRDEISALGFWDSANSVSAVAPRANKVPSILPGCPGPCRRAHLNLLTPYRVLGWGRAPQKPILAHTRPPKSTSQRLVSSREPSVRLRSRCYTVLVFKIALGSLCLGFGPCYHICMTHRWGTNALF